jgi:hypothetical protein
MVGQWGSPTNVSVLRNGEAKCRDRGPQKAIEGANSQAIRTKSREQGTQALLQPMFQMLDHWKMLITRCLLTYYLRVQAAPTWASNLVANQPPVFKVSTIKKSKWARAKKEIWKRSKTLDPFWAKGRDKRLQEVAHRTKLQVHNTSVPAILQTTDSQRNR